MRNRTAPLRVAVLCSGRAPGLVQLLNTDHRRGREYDLVCCLTSADEFAEEVRVERRGVPCLHHPIRDWCGVRGLHLRDLEARAEYDRQTTVLLEPYRPDLVLLDGYLLLLTRPMLERYQHRIVNVHHADLLVRDAAGSPKYPGLRAVRDAIAAGEVETRATAHIVTARLDDGPVLLRSWPYRVSGAARWALGHDAGDVFRASVWVHQEWMLRSAWPVMLAGAIELACLSLKAAGRPLDLRASGAWLAGADGVLAPDSTASTEGAYATR